MKGNLECELIDCIRSELRETARECICCLKQPELESRFTEFMSLTLYFSALSICMQTGINFKSSSEDLARI